MHKMNSNFCRKLIIINNFRIRTLFTKLKIVNFRPNYRQFHAYPGRPQLLRFSSSQLCSKDYENESKLEKFSTLLDAELLNLMELKKLSWSGIPRKVSFMLIIFTHNRNL